MLGVVANGVGAISPSRCVAVCCSVLQCVAVCCSVLQCVAVCCSVLQCVAVCCSLLQCVRVHCVAMCGVLSRTHSVSRCVANGVGVMSSSRYVAVSCSVVQCVAVSCSVVQCVAVY